jgi:hypothetical protein
MSSRWFELFSTSLALLFCHACCLAQESRWGSPDENAVRLIIDVEGKWARANCSPQPDLKNWIADDFQGTATNGVRYGKAEATGDPKTLARDCQLGEVRVQFFGDLIAIAYGAENRVSKTKDGKESKRCQVWTDTWLKRSGQWQLVAAQDTIVPCSP